MKKFIIVISAFLLLTACSVSGGKTDGKIKVVCTIFPQYDWVREIAGEKTDKFDLTMLIDGGVDFHSYNPSVSDISKLKSADLFIYIGGHSDTWVENALVGANSDMVVMNLVELLGDNVIMTESSHNCGCGSDCHCHKSPEKCDCAETGAVYDECDDEHIENALEADEHIWFSLRRAELICTEIAAELAKLDPENAQMYLNNAQSYARKLSALDAEYKTAVDAADVKTLVVADRFPFRYIAEDYGLSFYAAFQGCSAETEASFTTMISLANRLNQYGLNSVIVTESSDQSIAKTIISNTNDKNQQILVLNSFHGITTADAKNTTYLSIMESNLEILREALK